MKSSDQISPSSNGFSSEQPSELVTPTEAEQSVGTEQTAPSLRRSDCARKPVSRLIKEI